MKRQPTGSPAAALTVAVPAEVFSDRILSPSPKPSHGGSVWNRLCFDWHVAADKTPDQVNTHATLRASMAGPTWLASDNQKPSRHTILRHLTFALIAILSSVSPVAASTLGYWRFESAASLGLDASGQGRNLIPANVPASESVTDAGPGHYFPTHIPQTGQTNTLGVRLSGSNHLTCPDATAFDVRTQMTIEAFFNIETVSNDTTHALASQWNDLNNQKGWVFGVREDLSGTGLGTPRLRFVMSQDGTATVQSAANATNWALQTNHDYYAAVVYNAGTVTFYLEDLSAANPVLESQTVSGFVSSVFDSGGDFRVGGFQAGADINNITHFPGLVDEVRFSNVALPASQLLASPALAISSFAACPPNVSLGGLTQLTWDTLGLPVLRLTGGPFTNLNVTGLTDLITPPLSNTVVFTLTASNQVGVVNARLPVGVNEPLVTPLINEFLADNRNGLPDEDGDHSEWIELYNPNSFYFDLGGHFLTDDAGSATKWRFPSVILPPVGYLLVFASGKDRTNDVSRLHTNFRLSAGGGCLALVKPDGVTVAQGFTYPAQLPDISTSIGGYLATPTPGLSNSALLAFLITDLTDHFFPRPGSDDPLVIQATVSPIASPVQNAALLYRVMEGPEASIPMSVAGNQTWTATIPPAVALPGQMVRWRVTVQALNGQVALAPRVPGAGGATQYFGVVVAESSLRATDGDAASASRLNMTAVPGQGTLWFLASSNRAWTVETTDSLGTGAWSDFTNLPAASTNQMVLLPVPLTPAVPQRFFRARSPSSSVLSHFITREGDKLIEGGREWRAIGANVPGMILPYDFTLNLSNRMVLPNAWEQEDAFKAFDQMNARCIRWWNLPMRAPGESGADWKYVQAPGVFNEAAFLVIDRALALANQYGVRVIFDFTADSGDYLGGIGTYAAWRGKTRSAFWTDPELKADYKATLAYVLNRTNTITGLPYKDDKAILCWEFGNEMRTETSAWVGEMAAYIKSLDTNHLVMDANDSTIPTSPDPNVDIVTRHYYGGDWVANCRADMAQARGKRPFIIGEFGLSTSASTVGRFLDEVVTNGPSGALVWSMYFHHGGGGFKWHQIFTDPSQESYHWPGFPSGDVFGESPILATLRSHAFDIPQLPLPLPPIPDAPQMLPCAGVPLLTWRGSAGASSYDLERAPAPGGPWICVSSGVSDAETAYRPLLSDTSASIGGTFYYRVRAHNESGTSLPSNVVGPVLVTNLCLMDELKDFSLVKANSSGLGLVNDHNGLYAEYPFRAKGGSGEWLIYQTLGDLARFVVVAYFITTVAPLQFEWSSDGTNYVGAAASAQSIRYRDWQGQTGRTEVTYQSLAPTGARCLRITWTGPAELDRVEIYHK